MTNALPIRVEQFRLGDFAHWLLENGAEICKLTNPYEVIRYRAYTDKKTRAEIHIVYRKDNGLLTFTGYTRKHYQAFLEKKTLQGASVPKAERKGPSKTEIRREGLIARDGDECWFCGLALGEDATIEHLVPRSKGGVNHLDNYVLAHRKCNSDAADKPLVAKLEMRARLRVGEPA
jgi:hypothetical protein